MVQPLIGRRVHYSPASCVPQATTTLTRTRASSLPPEGDSCCATYRACRFGVWAEPIAMAYEGSFAQQCAMQDTTLGPLSDLAPVHRNKGARTAGRLMASLFLIVAAWSAYGQQVEFNACGSLQNAYGPYDYRTERDKLNVVEAFHFTPEVETLIRGHTGLIGDDLDYTLRAAPNHHRALVAMMRLGEREKTTQPKGARHTVECYFERATRFATNDTVARALYATYLAKSSRVADAIAQLEAAARTASDNGFAHYNIGLVYLEMKQYDRAVVQAHRAMAAGFIRPALIDGLKQAGAWKELEATGTAASASTPQTPASAP